MAAGSSRVEPAGQENAGIAQAGTWRVPACAPSFTCTRTPAA